MSISQKSPRSYSFLHVLITLFAGIFFILIGAALITQNMTPKQTPNIYFTGEAASNTPAYSQNGISVTGSSTVFVAPDVAIMHFGVESYNTELATAQSENSERMQAIIAAFAALEVEEKNMQTSNYNVYTAYKDRQKEWWALSTVQVPEVEYFRVSQDLTVRVTQLDTLEKLLNAAVTNGVNSIGSIEFTVQDFADAREKAYKKAAETVQQRAEYIARSMGVQAGEPLDISAHHDVFHPYFGQGRSALANQTVMFESRSMDMAEGSSISSGQIEVQVNITARYSIEY